MQFDVFHDLARRVGNKSNDWSDIVMKYDALKKFSNRPTVLLAEDDPDQSEMLTEMLEGEGYAVDAARTGISALKMLGENVYELIILDIRMPGMDGGVVLRKFRELETIGRTPVIVVSAFATENECEHYKALGADACFSKPYDSSDLFAAIAAFVPANTTLGRKI